MNWAVRVLLLPRPIQALILIVLGILIFWFGPIFAVIFVQIIGALIVLAGIIILIKELQYAVKR